MKLWLQRIQSRLSLFWRYFFLLALVAGMFLVALTLAVRLSSDALQDAYLDQVEESFYHNCDTFSNELFRTRNLLTALAESAYFTRTSQARQPLSAADHFNLSETQQAFVRQCSMLNLPSEHFLYFARSRTCVTRYRCFVSAEDCFRSYIVYDREEFLPDQLQELTDSSQDRHLLLPAAQVSIGAQSAVSALTFLALDASQDQVCGFLYPVSTVLDYFHMNTLPEGTSLELTDSSGTVLLAHNAAADSASTRFSSRLSSLDCTVTLGIPQSHFQRTVRSAQAMANLIFLISVALGLLMCFAFSHISVQPFRRLIRDHTANQNVESSANELVVIDTFLKSAQERNESLRSMLLSSLLMRAFSGLPIPRQEYEPLSSAFPLFRQSLHAAIVRNRDLAHTPESQSSTIRLLQSALPGQFLCEYINLQESVLLFRADAANLDLLNAVLLDLNNGSEDHPRIVCGVSAPFTGLDKLGDSIRQAQFCIPEHDERMVVLFSEHTAVRPDLSAAPAFDLKHFQQALTGWNQSELLDQLDALILMSGKTKILRPEELFYSILHLLRSAAYAGKLSFDEHSSAAYLHTQTPATNFRQLIRIVDDLFQQRLTMQMSEKQQLHENIVTYIRDNLSDASMDLYSLAQTFCISTRSIQRVVMSVTGMNFNDFLNLIRVEEAARLLRETDETINTIAARCGYPVISTFYRNFRKHYHVTPVEYKDTQG